MVPSLRYLAAALAIALAAVFPASAQYGSGVLEGAVFQSGERPLRGAVVTVSDVKGSFKQSVTTDVYGRYRVGQLAAGKFEVKVTHTGFKPMSTRATHQGYGVLVVPYFVLTKSSPD